MFFRKNLSMPEISMVNTGRNNFRKNYGSSQKIQRFIQGAILISMASSRIIIVDQFCDLAEEVNSG